MPLSCLPQRFVVLLLTAGLIPMALAQEARVHTVDVECEAIEETIELTGSVVAPRTANLSSDVEGRIADLHVSLGDNVEDDQTLLVIDDAEIEQQARAADAQYTEAQAELDEARRLLDEARQLGEGQNIARSELRQRENAVVMAEAVLERRDAERERLSTQLARHRLKAPFTGMITQRNIEVGEWSSPGNELLTLVDLERLRLDIAVPLSLYSRMDDADLKVRLPGDPSWRSAHTLARVPREDDASRQFLLRAALDDAPPLLPGMSVRARLQLSGEQGPTVPRDALIRRPDGNISLWLVRQDGDTWRAEQRRVTTGPSQDGTTAILDGVSPGDRVVVEGNQRLEDGQRLILENE